jgi:SagB-type dehydrogenase family enzyme
MSNQDIQVCREYEESVIRRASDWKSALVPRSHNVNWEDQPSRFKVYFDTPRLPLPERLARLGTLAETAARPEDEGSRDLSLEELATLLRLSNGVLRRKLDINWNLDHNGRAAHAHAVYGRPAASGGGMYPYELYLVTGRGSAVLPGAYHYDTAHHALEQLAAGDLGPRVRAAVKHHPAAEDASYFLLVAINFWKNYFKYHNFCYHVVTQDVGAELASVRMVARSLKLEPTFLLWFEDEVLNRILGLETSTESVFAVVALGHGQPGGDGHDTAAGPSPDGHIEPGWRSTPLTRVRSFQRSKQVFELPLIESVHRSALLEDEPLPASAAVAGTHCRELSEGGTTLPLPPAPGLLDVNLFEVFLRRNSSWGKMSGEPGLDLPQLAAMLRYATSAQSYAGDARQAAPQARFTRLLFFANHVNGLPAGVYSYDPDGDCLRVLGEGQYGHELQRRYFLENYNMEQAAVVFAVVGRIEAMLEVFGNRGARIMNAEVGLVAQHLYMAAAALGVGCGAVLGFDNIALNRPLGLEGSDQTSLLLLLVGSQRAGQGFFDYRLI